MSTDPGEEEYWTEYYSHWTPPALVVVARAKVGLGTATHVERCRQCGLTPDEAAGGACDSVVSSRHHWVWARADRACNMRFTTGGARCWAYAYALLPRPGFRPCS